MRNGNRNSNSPSAGNKSTPDGQKGVAWEQRRMNGAIVHVGYASQLAAGLQAHRRCTAITPDSERDNSELACTGFCSAALIYK